MKLAYKIGGIGLAGGASVGAYLLIPSSTAKPEEVIQNPEALSAPELASNSGAWQKDFKDQGYVPISFSNTSDIDFLGLSRAYGKVNGIAEDSRAESELVNLCNSFIKQEELGEDNKAKAKRWCFKPRTVENILKSQKRKQIYTIQGDVRVWNKAKIKDLATKYMANNNDKLKMLTGWEEDASFLVIDNNDLNGDLVAFTKACDNVLEAKSYEDKLDEKIDQATNWCTEEVA